MKFFNWLLIPLLMVLVSCPIIDPTSPEVARVEIAPGAILLTKAGESHVLSAKAFDAQGKELNANFIWTSSNPAVASVDSSGKLTALSELGSVQISAQVQTSKSTIPVMVAKPVDGAVLVSDQQILSDPQPVSGTELAPGGQYTIVLTGIAPPAPGTILMSRESKALGGKVISSVVDGSNVLVTLEWVSFNQLFSQVDYQNVLNLAEAQMQFSAETQEFFDIAHNPDGSFDLKLKPSKQISASGFGVGMNRQSVQGTRALGPFKCEVKTSAFQIELAKAEINFNANLSVETSGDPLKLVIKGKPTLRLKLKPMLNAALTGKFSCKLELGQFKILAPGPWALILSGFIPFGPGFEIEAKAPIGGVGLEIEGSVGSEFAVGFDCTSGSCESVGSFTPKGGFKIQPIVPIQAPKIELNGFAFFFFDANLTVLQFAALEVKAGIKLETKLASEETQAADPTYKSEYALKLENSLGVGKDFDSLLKFLKIVVKKPELKVTTTLGSSPAGDVSVDKSSFKTGDTINFKVKLDTTKLNFPIVGYNINSVILYHKQNLPNGSLGLEVLRELVALPGQTDFEIPWVATFAGDVSDNFLAFVETALLPPLRLEIGTAKAVQGTTEVDFRVGTTVNGTSPCTNDQRQVTGTSASIIVSTNCTLSNLFWQFFGSNLGGLSRGSLKATLSFTGAASAFINGGYSGFSKVLSSVTDTVTIDALGLTGTQGSFVAKIELLGSMGASGACRIGIGSSADYTFQGYVDSGTFATSLLIEGFIRGKTNSCGQSSGPQLPTVRQSQTITFVYGVPFKLHYQLDVAAQGQTVNVTQDDAAAQIEVNYRWLGMTGLPANATITSNSGIDWSKVAP